MADIAEDIARLAKQNSARLVPESGPVGYYLRKTGAGPGDFEFVQGPRSEILDGNGDPNGVHEGRIGDLYVERDAPALWQNTDGQTAWQTVGATAVSPAALSRVLFSVSFDTSSFYMTFAEVERVGASDATLTIGNGSSTDDVIVINEAGIYAIALNFKSTSLADGDGMDLRLSFPGAFGGDLDPVELYDAAGVVGDATITYTYVGYLDADDIYGNFLTDPVSVAAGSWCVVQRLA